MSPEMALAAALAALQALVLGILMWLVQRVGELTRTQSEMNGNYRAVAEWKGSADLRHAEDRAEIRTRFEYVDKLGARVTELEYQQRMHNGAS